MSSGQPVVAWIVLALLIGGGASPLRGQGPRLPPPLSVSGISVEPARFASLPHSTARKQTYWLEGGLIGTVGGMLLAQLVNGFCEGSGCHNDRRTFAMLVGGFVMGALVGGGIEKKP